MVLHDDDSEPRGFWKLAQVKELLKGRDQPVCGAVVVVVPVKNGRTNTPNRPIQRLYPLEACDPKLGCHECQRLDYGRLTMDSSCAFKAFRSRRNCVASFVTAWCGCDAKFAVTCVQMNDM